MNDMVEPSGNLTSGAVRRKGLLKALGGLASIYLLWPLGLMGLLERVTREGEHSGSLSGSLFRLAGSLLVMPLSAPFVLFCIGILEAITGTRFRHISSAWNQMNEWKQGVMSFLLLWVGIGLIGLVLYLAVLYYS